MTGLSKTIDIARDAPLADLVARAGVVLRHDGRDLVGLCPFHAERTPSFRVYMRGNNGHCFGCGWNGDSIRFVRDFERLSFSDAVERLAGAASVGRAVTVLTTEPVITQAATATINASADDIGRVRWLWSCGVPITNTVAEHYLRAARGLSGKFPATLRLLPAHGDHAPALMAALGIADEPEPGVLAISDRDVKAVHITALKPDGSGKADVANPKKIIGRDAMGVPVIVAPLNDLLGLAITEGIEDALSIHEATGLGAWVSCGAGRMPALASGVPDYADCVTIYADDDRPGRANATALLAGLTARRIFAQVKFIAMEASS